MKTAAIIAIAATGLLLATGLTASADRTSSRLGETEALAMSLGTVTGVAYYTLEKDGVHLVATMSPAIGETVRFEGVLQDGETARVSVPRGVDEPARMLAFKREGDAVIVTDLATLTD